ncbi:MAG: exopolysaccharide biosynthesis polyprenyl glycosylphosphotransferase, partial [Solirubrobacterales bacterium]|nr:exopolysaccharide biosynthesis polyprenyl glycosylphosphotransferase [Solirubrobacterales bacterium]
MERALTSIQRDDWRRAAGMLDILALLVASLICFQWVRHGQLDAWATGAGSSVSDLIFAAMYATLVLCFTRERAPLSQRLLPSAFAACADALRACTLAILLASGIEALLGSGRGAPGAIELWAVTLGSMCLTRVAILNFGRLARRRGRLLAPTLVVGAGVIGARVVHRLSTNTDYGLQPVGFLDADPSPRAADLEGMVPVLGAPEDLREVCQQTGATHVILAFSSERDHRLVDVVRVCRELGVEVLAVPRLYESVNERATLDHIGGLPLLSLGSIDPKGWQFAVKHVVDRLLALAALTALSPLLIAIALAVKLTSPGPVIFRQRRLGRDGRVFDVLKFRTMREFKHTPEFRPSPGSAPGGVEGIDRRTRLGRWLRSSSLDELPQLFNVLRGEMSIVGPRPERPEYAEQFARDVHGYRHRDRVKSGITGWAQVNGLRGQTSIADRVEWDNYYIENWSLALELRTIGLTIAELLRFRDDKPPAPIALSSRQPQALDDDRSLDLITERQDEPEAVPTWFCGYCGAPPATGTTPAPVARVCQECGQGLMLEVRSDVAPKRDEAFLVVDTKLRVQAVSNHAEKILDVEEEAVTDRPVAELLVGADSEHGEEQSLTDLLGRAARSNGELLATVVRPRSTFGVRLHARITSCGPPRASLIVLEPEPETAPRRNHLRL